MSKFTTLIRNREKKVRAAMEDELRLIIGDSRSYHDKVVARWGNKPKWRRMFLFGNTRLVGRLVSSNAKIWRYVDEGTGRHGPRKRAYYIYPKLETGLLFFRTGYKAKTKPIAKYNAGAGKAFGPLVSRPFVLHPGIKPRKFTETFADKLRKGFKKRIQNAIQRA